ncbi:MAG: PD40 domain-containing protein [Saprospiraceae bacterium]|nr:PD40 domain-containing protein [Saprospiraceae bacterium]
MNLYISKYTYVFIFISLMTYTSEAQSTTDQLSPKEKKIYADAKKYAQLGNLIKSNQNFEKLLAVKKDFVEGYLRLASNYFQMKSYEMSERLFQKAIYLAPDFDAEMYYSLAMSQIEQNKYIDAANNLDIYIQKEKSKTDKVKRAMKMSVNLRFIEFAFNHPVPFRPQNVGENINTNNSEYSPILSLDGTNMIFTRNVKMINDFIGQEDFYMSAFSNSNWTKAMPLTDLNTYQNEGAFAISSNGKYIVFTACDRKDAFGSCDLYYSMLMDGHWTQPVNMGHKVNSAAWDSQPTLSADARTLIFASKRLGTTGGSDLFITYRDAKNAWVTPINLGPVINSEGDDESPFLHSDGSTLYFRSNGRPGMGKHDIYYSKKNDTTALWQTPVNIGYPINTIGEEGSLTVSLDGKNAYYASDINHNSGQKMNHLDIYTFELYEEARPKPTTFIKGYVTDAATGKALKAKVIIKDINTGLEIFQIETDDDGYFLSGITSGKNYVCIVEQKNYTYHAENFDLTNKNILLEPYVLNIQLIPVIKSDSKNSPIILQNIFFSTGSAELLEASNHEILLIYKMMVENPSIKIEIIGHTDDIGSEDDNYTLSQKRAKAVAEAIIAKGIDFTRISSEGKGETNPIADNLSESGRKKNRRTEMYIIY